MMPPQLPPITCRYVNSVVTEPVSDKTPYLHSDTGSSLQASSNVCTVPCHAQWDLGVYADRSKHSTGVLHPRLCGRCKHRKSCNGDELEAKHEDASLANTIGVPAG
jgi:hypothetical protein